MSSRTSAVAAAALLALIGAEGFTSPQPLVGVPSSGRSHKILLNSSPENGKGDTSSPFFATELVDKESDEARTATTATETTRREEVMEEANDALSAVGWSSPLNDAEMTSEDPFVKMIDEQIQADVGVGLEELLNPAKVVNLERDLFNLRSELAYLTGKGSMDVTGLTTEECDGGDGGDDAEAIRNSISKKEKSLIIERRAVFRGWLKNVFLGQAILSLALSWVMVSDPAILFGRFDWFNTLNLDISIRVLGFWWWWLFIIPSLRSRRPSGPEKKALDIAFLGTPAISLLAPAFTKDTELIWFGNLAVTVAAYAYGFLLYNEDDADGSDGDSGPAWLKFVFKSLDFGSGRERGARQ